MVLVMLRSFRACRRGNVSLLFAVALVPLVLCIGVSIDYTRASTARSSLQNALDAATLAMAKEAGTLSASQLQIKLDAKFRALLNNPEIKDVAVAAEYATGSLSTTASAKIGTSFMALAGRKSMKIGVKSGSAIATGKLEIVLALDNTGSMANNGKIQALIAASHDFVTAMQTAAAGTGNVKISVVPFDTKVNIGKASNGQPWIDWTGYDPASTYGDGVDLGGGTGTYYDCKPNGKCKLKKGGGAVGPTIYPAWLGCLVDRDEPYNVANTLPAITVPETWYPASDCTLAPILPLTSDFAALHAEIDKMKASGNTNLPIGFAWAWNMLTPNAPTSTAAAPAADIEKFIVFLTDGVNTQDRWTSDAALIDARALAVCTAIKATGVKIFTIRVMDGNAGLLQNCASDVSMYFEVTQAAQIAPAFQKIVQNFGRLRLSR